MYRLLKEKNELCTGCGACVNICPTDSIQYKELEDEDGSLVAEIKSDNCIECGLCRETCPILNPLKSDNEKQPECHAVCADDEIRMKSSSGGAFSVFANWFLENNGYVCGVEYDENLEIRHTIVSNKSEIQKLRRSKYCQSNPGNCYKNIKKLLDKQKYVLMVGTPCQVAGLKAFLKREYNNLITVDLICNYAPSKMLFRRYIEENFDKKNIDKIDYRVKDYGWNCEIHAVTYKDGTREYRRPYNDSWEKGYHSRLFMRDVCEHCKFAGSQRQGDLTIGDFWHIGEFVPELDDRKGTSCLYINNEKGKKLYDIVSKGFIIDQEVDSSYMKYNRQESVEAHQFSKRFYELLKKTSFNDSVEKSLNEKYDIVLFGNWSEKNYGSELTYYALYSLLVEMHYDVLLVERPAEAVWGPNETPILFKSNPYPSYALSKIYQFKDSMYELNKKADIFIIGSDQLWHHDLYEPFGKVNYLDFIRNDKRKIAYATSFGREYWSGDSFDIGEVAQQLKGFDYISTREESGVDLCRDIFSVNATNVLDPVFLCDKKHYLKLAEKSELVFPDQNLGCYVLDLDEQKTRIIKLVKEELGLHDFVITDAFDKFKENGEEIKTFWCEDWLKNIIESEFVVVDSFHGMCFAIIFEKQFIAIANQNRGTIRFTDLLKKLGLESRLLYTNQMTDKQIVELARKKIDYNQVNILLSRYKQASFDWLKQALESEKRYTPTEYDVLYNYLLAHKYETAEQRLHSNQIGGLKWDIGVHREEINGLRYDIGTHREEINGLRYDIGVHREEINGLRYDIGVHREEINGLRYDIGVHREEINGLRYDIGVHREEIEAELRRKLNKPFN